ncbi:unnamed protein product [Allacma fusca]|uniref:Uncharacterized protein n=1 Tax=Allacma fusca TaxID=39272 RepID=A0A8J2PUK2_9HEXA|nr:unnamed protein product [Allacma fusca]
MTSYIIWRGWNNKPVLHRLSWDKQALKATVWAVIFVFIMTDKVLAAPANTPSDEEESQAQLPVQNDSTAIKNSANVPEEPLLPPGATPSSLADITQYKLRPDSLDLSGQNKKSQEVLNFSFDEENSPDLQLTEQNSQPEYNSKYFVETVKKEFNPLNP